MLKLSGKCILQFAAIAYFMNIMNWNCHLEAKRSLFSSPLDIVQIFGQNADNTAHSAALVFSTDVLYSSLLSSSFMLSSQSEFGTEAESPTDHPQGDFPGR